MGDSLQSYIVSNKTGVPATTMIAAMGTDGVTVTDVATTLLGPIGANNANNAYDSGLVVANNVGSVLERQEYIQHEVESRVGQPLALAKYAGDNATNSNIASLLRWVTDNISQCVTTTIDLNQAAASYDLFTGMGQNVILESLILRCPAAAAGGALTSISVQTDTAMAHTFITAAQGVVGNLTSEAEINWYGASLIVVGDKIQLTINGGATGVGYVVTVVAKYKSVVNGGYLA